MKEIYEMKGSGYSIRDIAGELDIARNTVRRYLKDPEAVMPKRRRRRSSKLDQYIEYVDRRLSEGLENCVVLWRELQGLGYQGGYSLVKTYVSHAAGVARFRPRCGSRRSPGSRHRWTGAASATWTKGGGSGKCGPS